MATKFCSICQNSKVKRAGDYKYDMIERTTSCRLVLEGGSALKVNEILTKEDEKAKQKYMNCLCQIPSSELVNFKSKGRSPRKGCSSEGGKSQGDAEQKPSKIGKMAGKTKSKNDRKSSTKPRSPKEEIKMSNTDKKQDSPSLSELLKYSGELKGQTHKAGNQEEEPRISDTDVNEGSPKLSGKLQDGPKLYGKENTTANECERRFRAIVKPVWFIPLGPRELFYLKHLPTAILNDGTEHGCTRTRHVLNEVGIRPMFKDMELSHALRLCKNNALRLLVELLNIINDDALNEHFPNKQLLMSAICWYELPLMLEVLMKRLPTFTSKGSTFAQFADPDRSPRPPKIKKSPYLEPVIAKTPTDWLKKRRINERKTRRAGHILRQIVIPEDAHRSQELDHIEFPSLLSEERDEDTDTEELCCVVVALLEYKPFKPIAPPNSRLDARNYAPSPVSNVLKAVLDRFEEINYKFPNGHSLEGILKLLRGIGMISASFPEIKHHPTIVHLIKYINHEEITAKLKKKLLDEAKSKNLCLRKLYPKKQMSLPNMGKSKKQLNWAFMEKLRKKANKNRDAFLTDFANCRIKNTVNFYHTLNPEYFIKKSFHDIFFAYMPLSKGTINYWPNWL